MLDPVASYYDVIAIANYCDKTLCSVQVCIYMVCVATRKGNIDTM